MSNKLTGRSPSPWHSDRSSPGDHIRILGADGRAVCSMFCASANGPGRVRQIANARLIVSAPLLLGTLDMLARNPSEKNLKDAQEIVEMIVGPEAE